jgi:hypothetical protein
MSIRRCPKKSGELGSGIPWNVCDGIMEHEYTYDNDDRKSVQYRRDVCIECGHRDMYITWQR